MARRTRVCVCRARGRRLPGLKLQLTILHSWLTTDPWDLPEQERRGREKGERERERKRKGRIRDICADACVCVRRPRSCGTLGRFPMCAHEWCIRASRACVAVYRWKSWPTHTDRPRVTHVVCVALSLCVCEGGGSSFCTQPRKFDGYMVHRIGEDRSLGSSHSQGPGCADISF